MFGDIASWVQRTIEQFGPVGVAFLVVLENLFPPIPSEVILPFAGYVAERGPDSVLGMILAATAGSVVGNLVLYAVAAWFGEDRVRRFVVLFGRWFALRETDLNRAEAWFNRRSFVAVAAGRCVPLIRSVVSLPARFYRMNHTTYVLGTALGSLVWNRILIGSGAALSTRWDLVESYVGCFQYAVIAAILALIVRFVLRRRSTRFTKPLSDSAE